MSLIDEQIQDAMRKGQFDQLPGAGKPLQLDDEANTPAHLRMAHKILRDNDLVPDWVAQGQELDTAREKLLQDARRFAHAKSGAPGVVALDEAAEAYNRQVLSYNLKVPKGVAHKRHIDIESERMKLRSAERATW